MKKKIGEIYNKPIVIGNKNLKSRHELSLNDVNKYTLKVYNFNKKRDIEDFITLLESQDKIDDLFDPIDIQKQNIDPTKIVLINIPDVAFKSNADLLTVIAYVEKVPQENIDIYLVWRWKSQGEFEICCKVTKNNTTKECGFSNDISA